ncbi:MAG TPA: DUF748 domain-containing protein, partial [Candidatus Omnitrophota bacterium]|nr:DUF748 domain-containing protein [Candidatus Omnitrophota bacterium]
VQRLELQSPKALARKGRDGYGWRVEARRIAIERAAMTTEGDLSIGDLRLAAPVARLQRTAKGFAGFASTEPEAADTPLPRVTLARLRIGGGRVEFEDRTPSEAVRLTVDGIDLVARELDTGTPEHDSPFTLKARAGASVLAASGSLRPFAPSFSGKMKGDVKSFELPPLSPYAADSLGVHLHTGQFDGDLSLAVEHGALDGRMDMVLSNLFVAQPDPNAPIAKQADMPVETVLDLLRDSEDRIRLTIPVRGDLSKPDFDVSDAVSQAVGGALKSTVVTTLKVAFPVAALIGYVIDESSASRLSLEPLAFAAGDAALADSHPARLATVADLLRQRPGLKLTLCGAATMAADWPAVLERRRQEELGLLAKLQKLVGVEAKPEDIAPDRDALTALAEGRAQAVKAWLVKNGGIDAGRLFTCRPKVEPNGTGGPRVDLLL